MVLGGLVSMYGAGWFSKRVVGAVCHKDCLTRKDLKLIESPRSHLHIIRSAALLCSTLSRPFLQQHVGLRHSKVEFKKLPKN